MINKSTLRSELLQITVVILGLLAVGMIAWVGGAQKIQNILVGNATPKNASGDLWTLVNENGNSSVIADSVLSGSADVRDIRSNIEYDTANGTTRVLHLISAQSCYQALSAKMQETDYLSSLLISDGLKMDVVIHGKRRTLRQEMILHDKMHKPAYDLYYWVADWDEDLQFTREIVLIQDGQVIAELGERKFAIVVEFFVEISCPCFSGVLKGVIVCCLFHTCVSSFFWRLALVRCVLFPSVSPRIWKI